MDKNNNKEIKMFNKRLLILFVIMLAILGTLLTIKADATLQIQSLMSHFTSRPSGTYIEFAQLDAYYDILCCERGQHIPSKRNVTMSGSSSNGSFEYDFGHLTGNDQGKVIEQHRINYQGNDFSSSSYSHETYGYYKLVETHIATPKEAYIIAEMKEAGAFEKNHVQIAWWNTDFGSLGAEVGGNDLTKESEAFEEYMKIITKTTSIDQIQYAEQDFSIIENDVVVETGRVEAPVIDYNPTWNDDADQNGVVNQADEITVSFDYNTQKYVIGPFSIDYVKRYIKAGSREKVDFACITNAKLVGEVAGEDRELILDKDWNFKFLANQARDMMKNINFQIQMKYFILKQIIF